MHGQGSAGQLDRNVRRALVWAIACGAVPSGVLPECAMRTAILLSLLAAVSGCAVVPPSAWNFDPTRPPARSAVPAPGLAALTSDVAVLRSERDAIRARIAAERDVWQRQREYAQLHRVGLRLSPLERQLAAIEPTR
jgi:hypothetical protein